jgi:hypothetical protein
MVWTNKDGLRVRFPSDELGTVIGGEYQGAGATRVIEVELNAVDLTTSAQAFGAPYLIVPRNSVIEEVEVISEVALAGGTSIDIGLQRLDGTTELDYDGLANDLVIASLNVDGEKNVLRVGSTSAGALIGTETAFPGYITVLETGTHTAGRLVIRVVVRVKDADSLVQF